MVPDHENKTFSWEQYQGTPIEIQAKAVISWAKEALKIRKFDIRGFPPTGAHFGFTALEKI